ncbi:MAG: DUF6230 family protein [Nocardioides sp.]|uniref:DUF6230 family protein n=1 Tax=Nocardioides sp. TaxID=35761 RepID=UPI0039E68007
MKHNGGRRRAQRGHESGPSAWGARTWQRLRADAVRRTHELVDDAKTRSAAMVAEAESTRRGNRKRGVFFAAFGFAGLAIMFRLVSADVLAVNFTTQNGQFQLYSNYLDAQKAAGYLDTSTRAATSGSTCPQGTGTQTATSGQCGVADLGINTAKLAGLCAIQTESIGSIGSWSLKLTAGQAVATSFTGTSVPTPPGGTLSTSGGSATLSINSAGTINETNSTAGGIIKASNLYLNTNSLNGFGNLVSGLYLGQSADTVAASASDTNATVSFPAVSGGQLAPTAGNFGLYADQLNVAGLNGYGYGLRLAGSITLPNLKITVNAGSQSQSNC